MANKIERFEDFIAWQKARSLTREADYIPQPRFHQVMINAVEVGQVVGGLRLSVEKRKAAH